MVAFADMKFTKRQKQEGAAFNMGYCMGLRVAVLMARHHGKAARARLKVWGPVTTLRALERDLTISHDEVAAVWKLPELAEVPGMQKRRRR